MHKKLSSKPLKLLATCAKDLDVISACAQDALVPLQGMKYNPKEKKFNIFTHRYKWETHHHAPAQNERVHSGLSFENVEKVQYAGFNPQEEAHNALYLLAVKHLPPYVHMTFSQNAKIRLKSPKLKVKLTDSDHPCWPSLPPQHE